MTGDTDVLGIGLRVVVESSNRASALAQMVALESAGVTTIVCPGPAGLAGRTCPVVEGAGCPWVEAADAVLCDLDLDDPDGEEVLRAVRRTYPAVPVVVEVDEETARQRATLLAGCHLVYPFDMDKLVRAVIAAATSRHAGSAPERAPVPG